MNKSDIIRETAEKFGLHKTQSAEIVNHIFDSIAQGLASGEERVSISGFGTFRANIVPAHMTQSPLDGKPFKAARTSKVKFHPSDLLKDNITKKNKAEVYKKDKAKK